MVPSKLTMKLILNRESKSKVTFECRRKAGTLPGEKPAEASMDWKPNAHKAASLGFEPATSLVQGEGTTTAPTLFRSKISGLQNLPMLDYIRFFHTLGFTNAQHQYECWPWLIANWCALLVKHRLQCTLVFCGWIIAPSHNTYWESCKCPRNCCTVYPQICAGFVIFSPIFAILSWFSSFFTHFGV